jgi:hypothetical protein
LELIKSVAKFARDNCSCFISGQCVLEPHGRPSCLYERNNQRIYYQCKYFISSVLPGDPELEARYNRHIHGKVTDKNIGKCSLCGKSYEKASNRQKYCASCRHEAKMQSDRDRQKKKYWNDKQPHDLVA